MATLAAAFVAIALFGVTVNSPDVSGAENQTVRTILNISNAKPIIYDILLDDSVSSPARQIELTANDTVDIFCNISVTDFNGFEDINLSNVSAILWRNDSNVDFHESANDFNSRYENSSCNTVIDACTSITADNTSCECRFAVQYFAYNGSWTCQARVEDAGGISSPLLILNDTRNTTSEVQTLVGVAADGTLDFGDVAASQTSPEIDFNISNVGNVILNYSFYVFGGADDGTLANLTNYPNVSMVCEQGGNITDTAMRYDVNTGTAYAAMNRVNSSPIGVVGLVGHPREDDVLTNSGNETNETFWRIRVPITVGGTCEGSWVIVSQEWEDYAGE